jgi:hypothetical protein
MNQLKQFLSFSFTITDTNFKLFFVALFSTTLIPYLPNVFVFLPATFLGFNWSGWAWISALVLSLVVLSKANVSFFPWLLWLPWFAYLFLYLLYDFSFDGLQLSLQYFLPVFMGYLAASFSYTSTKILWIFQGLFKTTVVIFLICMFYQFLTGFMPSMAANPMFMLVLGTISLGLFFFTNKNKFLAVFGLLFLVPFLSVTRMALLVFGVSFALHFANRSKQTKIAGVFFGGLLLLFVFNSKGFQEKTFNSGQGETSDLSVNYYESDSFNSNGRKSWQMALERGLKNQPIFGNGPRADAPLLGKMIGAKSGEAHNDYLSVRYNYGYVGLALLLFGFAASFFQLYQMSRLLKDKVFQLLILSNLTLFIGFLLFMYSDNILKYTIWFPNYFFVLMGMCYSIYHKGFKYN